MCIREIILLKPKYWAKMGLQYMENTVHCKHHASAKN